MACGASWSFSAGPAASPPRALVRRMTTATAIVGIIATIALAAIALIVWAILTPYRLAERDDAREEDHPDCPCGDARCRWRKP